MINEHDNNKKESCQKLFLPKLINYFLITFDPFVFMIEQKYDRNKYFASSPSIFYQLNVIFCLTFSIDGEESYFLIKKREKKTRQNVYR